MSALALSNPVSQPPLSRYVTELPRVKSDELMSKARWNSVAAKICTVAFLAIAAVAIAISVGIAIPMPAAVLIALVIGTIPLQFANTRFRANSSQYIVLAAEERGKRMNWKKFKIGRVKTSKVFLINIGF